MTGERTPPGGALRDVHYGDHRRVRRSAALAGVHHESRVPAAELLLIAALAILPDQDDWRL